MNPNCIVPIYKGSQNFLQVKIEREDGTPMRRITLTGEKSKIVMATYLINQTISTFSTAPKREPIKAEAPIDPKLKDTSGLDQMNSLHPGLPLKLTNQEIFVSKFRYYVDNSENHNFSTRWLEHRRTSCSCNDGIFSKSIFWRLYGSRIHTSSTNFESRREYRRIISRGAGSAETNSRFVQIVSSSNYRNFLRIEFFVEIQSSNVQF